MRKRILWSTIIATMIMALVIPLNFVLYPDTTNIPEEQRTISQQIAAEQRFSAFITLNLIEGQLAWLIGFMVVNEFFRQHPDLNSLVTLHKKKYPAIPDEYYRLDGIDKRINNEDVAEGRRQANANTLANAKEKKEEEQG